MNEQKPEVEDVLPDNIEVATPGQLLQEAREAAQLSVDDISRKLHLKAALIIAIEKNNFDEIASVTFARGYLKAYAKLVHADEEEVLTAFECFNDAEQQTQMQTFSNRKGKNKLDSWLMILTLLLVVGIVAAVAVWFMRNQQTEPTPVSASASTSEVVAQSSEQKNESQPQSTLEQQTQAHQTSDNLSPAGELLEPQLGQELEPEKDQEPEQEIAEPSEPDTDLTEQQSRSQSADESDIADTQSDMPEQSLNESESNETPVAKSAVTQSIAQSSTQLANGQTNIQEPNGGNSGDNSGESTFETENAEQESQQAIQETMQETMQEIVTAHLELRFEDSCWINIEDATGERIAIGTKVKGHYTSVHGVPPFTIKLGKPDVVSIWLDGQAREIPYYPKGSIANFELAAN